MSYIETVTPLFKRECHQLGLIRKPRKGHKMHFGEEFVPEVTRTPFETAFSAARSFSDLMVCWRWAPRDREEAILKRLEQLRRAERLTAEEEYTFFLLLPSDHQFELSASAQEVQMASSTKARLRR